MIIKKGTKLKVRGVFGRWQECIAKEDFDTEQERYHLSREISFPMANPITENFEPLGKKVQIKMLIDGKETIVKELE